MIDVDQHRTVGSIDMNQSSGLVVPFLVGTIVGGIAGAVAGTLLCEQTTQLASSLLSILDRRLNESERERLRFELLLQ
jgi:hypothetical protein